METVSLDAVIRLRSAEIIVADILGGRHDGKLCILWISARALAEINHEGALHPHVLWVGLKDSNALESIRQDLNALLGPSAPIPAELTLQRKNDILYVAKASGY